MAIIDTSRLSPFASTSSATGKTRTPNSASFSSSPASIACHDTTSPLASCHQHGGTKVRPQAHWWHERDGPRVNALSSIRAAGNMIELYRLFSLEHLDIQSANECKQVLYFIELPFPPQFELELSAFFFYSTDLSNENMPNH